jgi:phosphate:Na+ symporter
VDIVFLVIGGLGLFLFGMRIMSEALRRVASDWMRHILRVLTRNVLIGVLDGAGVTCLIQSSSATTVMVVGFVNAGLMTLRQAIGVILGANIGTTITAWMVSSIGVLKITNYALPAIGIGLVVSLVGKRQWRHWGTVLLGFGVLFFGLYLMKGALGPLGESAKAKDLMYRLAGHPLTGIAIGTIMTMIIQSSSATIAVAQLMAFQGILPFEHALHLILGDNIGTTITAQLASIGTNVEARRAARAHLMFKVVGVMILLPLVWGGHYSRFIEALIPGEITKSTIMVHIAASHTMFNMIDMAIFVPFAGVAARVVTRLVPGEPGTVPVEPQYLEEHLLDSPPIALEQARREVVRMIELAASAVHDASDAFFRTDIRALRLVRQKEDAIDNLQNKITQYLIRISRRNLAPADSNELPVLLHSVNDIERIGDHAINLLEAAERRIEGNLPFSDAALVELAMMRDEVERMFETVTRALVDLDRDAARAAFESEAKLNAMQKAFRESHLARLSAGECHFYSGLTFVDCLYYYEKIGDHLTNAAQAVLGDFQWGEKVRDDNPASSEKLSPGPVT